MGQALMENCTSLIVDCEVTKAAGMAKREVAPALIVFGRAGKILTRLFDPRI
jgi:hypothetical protein